MISVISGILLCVYLWYVSKCMTYLMLVTKKQNISFVECGMKPSGFLINFILILLMSFTIGTLIIFFMNKEMHRVFTEVTIESQLKILISKNAPQTMIENLEKSLEKHLYSDEFDFWTKKQQ